VKAKEAELTPRARAKRDQTRHAAQRLFLRNGFSETSTDALAAEAGVSKQTLYAYYPSKEALLADVLEQLIQAASESRSLRRRRSLKTPQDLRRAFLALAEDIIEQLMQPEYLALLRVIFNETPRFPRIGELFRNSVPERVLGTVSSVLSEAQAAGLVQVKDVRIGARMLVGPLLTFAILGGLLMAEEERKPPSRRELEKVVDLFLHGVSPRGELS
jgi:TetR/AcrR family transcriptional regulator, mexJK operon transcriptional repressor